MLIIMTLVCASGGPAKDCGSCRTVFGIGVGVAPVITRSGNRAGSYLGLAGTIYVGRGWRHDQLVIYFDGVVFRTEGSVTRMQGQLGAIGWYHYFGERSGQFYTFCGLGAYRSESRLDYGFGQKSVSLGFGWRFKRHLQTGFAYSFETGLGTSQHVNLVTTITSF